MNDWERFDKTLLPKKKHFHSSLNMENITALIIGMQKEYLKILIIKIQVIIIICMFEVINYYLQVYLKILEINTLKYMS